MILANRAKLQWNTKDGVRQANYWGSITQASTVGIGIDAQGHEVFVPMKDIVPMLDPNDLIVDGWDISKMNLAESMKRAKVLEWDVQRQLYDQVNVTNILYIAFRLDWFTLLHDASRLNISITSYLY